MSARIQTRSPQQQAVVEQLVQTFQIDGSKILFLNEKNRLEPWLNYKALSRIAKLSGRFRSLAEHFATYIEPLRQVVYSATVIDSDNFEYTRSGAATVGESLPEGEEADAHEVASARALRRALDAADFDPVNASVPTLDLQLSSPQHQAADQALSRSNDIKAAHKIAAEKGLIKPLEDDPTLRDYGDYRKFLSVNFGYNSMAAMKPFERAALINALRELPDVVAPTAGAPPESEAVS
jgi:hypothetical protein